MSDPRTRRAPGARRAPLLVAVWLWVGAPFAYGLYELALKLKQLFTG